MARPRLEISNSRLSITEKGVIDWMSEVAQFMIDFQERHNRTASRRSVDNYTVRQSNKFISLLAVDYIAFALQGRRPGGFPPVEEIRRWIDDKGIASEDPDSMAWAIATKISQEGTLSGTGPDDTKLNPGLIAASVSRIGKKHLKNIADELAEKTADGIFKLLSGSKATLTI